MKNLLGIFILAISLYANQCQAKLNVFACEPEWQSLAIELGGKNVEVFSATHALQDPHHIEARPSLIAKARTADIIFCTGAELEIGWLPLLLRQSANASIGKDQPGYFMAAEFVERLEVAKINQKIFGHVHAQGNPHVHLNPHNLLKIAKAFSLRLMQVDPQQKTYYQQKLDSFSQRWQAAIEEWQKKSEILKGKKVVVYHRNLSYLLNWLDMKEIADLEPAPGIPPTSGHLVRLLKVVKKQQPVFILQTEYQDKKSGQWLADKSGTPLIILPFTVGGNQQSGDLFKLFDVTLQLLLDHL